MIPFLPTPFGTKPSVRYNNKFHSIQGPEGTVKPKIGMQAISQRRSYLSPDVALLSRLHLDPFIMLIRLKSSYGTLKNTCIPKEEVIQHTRDYRT